MEQSNAPWTPEEVESINGYQEEAQLHPFTCGGACGNLVLIATTLGLVCNDVGCGYFQTWVHKFMADGSWRVNVEN